MRLPVRSALALLPLLGATLAACDSLDAGTALAAAPLDVALKLHVGVSGTTLIRSQGEWAAFWQQHHRDIRDGDGRPVNTVPPAVDFARQVVVGLFYGGSPNAGCTDDADVVRRVSLDGGTLVVEVGPLPDLGPCRMVVQPLDLVAVDVAPDAVRRQRFTGDVPGRTDPW